MNIGALLVAFALSFVSAPFVIRLLKRFQFGQSIRKEGPKSHQKKSGTPTIGGIIFLFGITVSVLIFGHFSFQTIFLLVLTLGYGLIGFLDDFIKIAFKRNLGLTAKQKIAAQLVLSIIVYVLLVTNHIDTHLRFPIGNVNIDLGWFYIPFLLFLIIGTTNATNLTDGLDGLLTGTAIIVFLAYSFISYQGSEHQVLVFASAVVGGLLAFLFFNKYPAQIFMGDTGSLAIGGALVGISILTKTELLLAIVGAIFVLETLSVIIQVGSFKIRKKLVFKMAPIHHHFEELGWSEKRVVHTFYMLSMIFSLFGVLLWNLN